MGVREARREPRFSSPALSRAERRGVESSEKKKKVCRIIIPTSDEDNADARRPRRRGLNGESRARAAVPPSLALLSSSLSALSIRALEINKMLTKSRRVLVRARVTSAIR